MFNTHCSMPAALELQRLLRLQLQRSAAARPLPPPPSRRASGPGCSWSRLPSKRSGYCDRCRWYLLPQRWPQRSWQMLSCSIIQCTRLSSRHSWSQTTHGNLQTSQLPPQVWCHFRAPTAACRAVPWVLAAAYLPTAAHSQAARRTPKRATTVAVACSRRTQHLWQHTSSQLPQTSCLTHRQVSN